MANILESQVPSTVWQHFQREDFCIAREWQTDYHVQQSNKTIEFTYLPFDHKSIESLVPKTIDINCSHKYIQIAYDECTKYIWIMPLYTKTGNEINEQLIKNIHTKSAIPKRSRTDDYGQFKGENFTQMAKQLENFF
ncbi:Integrase, catalytic core domain and Ribonuclease H-like domain-containing protein [Strongyloides ratti]|uniref:Integrase, catalytic core domain and Ribonuclease H-like domain-containing protein n=1 Tax=Strongyloides ratti TaxID=34506 RepID=A0A090L2E6_STRRB|nr:Integrase, catalytic core domain and Ribonuclease H-like domain-containing protein [Strongyloides ratti]CEF61634.1 Integrase, catalytic core domain and Ribonuclease H-like domain-containing protein [Strongyloides ratti]